MLLTAQQNTNTFLLYTNIGKLDLVFKKFFFNQFRFKKNVTIITKDAKTDQNTFFSPFFAKIIYWQCPLKSDPWQRYALPLKFFLD